MTAVIDPRSGDVEDDASSTRRHSLLSLAGSLLAEISLPKLAVAWTLLIGLPALALGLAPLVVSLWFATLSTKAATVLSGAGSVMLLAAVLVAGWYGGRRLLPIAERSFWSLNALAVQPAYAFVRELLRHLVEKALPGRVGADTRATVRATTAALAGVVVCVPTLWLITAVWPSTRWIGTAADLASPWSLVGVAVANSTVVVAAYFAAAALAWGIADATMGQPRTIADFPAATPGRRRWRIAHLSDIHIVGEQYGFRIECGRAGPRGNDRLQRVFAQLDLIHASEPLDAVLVSGDVTDAGRSAEWAVFFDTLAAHPRLAERVLILPGNHDVNVVDRANPARLDLPFSPNKRLRQARMISAMAAVQGSRVRVMDAASKDLGPTLDEALQPHRDTIEIFADTGSLRLARDVAALWAGLFPMVLPPDTADGLGIVVLNSNADTHFSFTNALGLVSTEHMGAVTRACADYPNASWLIALHHHMVEYPMPAKQFSERVGTALVNGSWFVRRLQQIVPGAVVMHGHRHIDWIGEIGCLQIVSAPSPVMEATNDCTTHFYVHVLEAGPDRLHLLEPQRIDVAGVDAAESDRTARLVAGIGA
ncbi:MAG: metallophosphoesterase [Rhodoplanes sp.]|uniref:metallophosphoesterase family protein n=1 Tax=Rhodoplanes sp. TaxID=1968906 RepID=UPI001817B31B|nr:metallophosphoesterase [Rhodoplanes sp.]NVO13538.1 metallophosphoesterase [Rhodoplanes sp.]